MHKLICLDKSIRIVSRPLLIVLLFVCMLLTGFVEYESDNLYSYQWGLKNNGNFLVDKGILAENHSIKYYDKAFADVTFYDQKEAVDYLRQVSYNPGFMYASAGVDIWWESAYKLFSSIENKRDAIVAIIDTGVDINHFELADNIWHNELEIPGNGIDDDQNGYVDDYYGYNFYSRNANVFEDATIDIHGTHSAGTIIAKHGNTGMRGIAYDSHVKVMPLKILGTNGKGYMASLVEAIKYAKNNGARICNISLGAYKYEANLDNVIKANPDMIFVVAAGNGANYIGYSLDIKNVYPAKFEYNNVIAVSNIGFDGERYTSSNYGSNVDIFAPGTFILSTTPNNSFGYLTGTSMAAPFVSATCAMIYSAFPNVPISSYRNLIINGATPITGLLGLSESNGMLNIYNTLMSASSF